MNVAKGFHNVPRLYGEEVRKVDKVTDLQSGLKTAAKVRLSIFYTLRCTKYYRNSALASMKA